MGLYRRGKIWHIQYFMNGRRVRESTGSPSKEFAQRCLDARKGDRSRNKFGLPGDSPTVEELATRFLEYSEATLTKKTVSSYRGITNKIIDEWGAYRIGDLTHRQIDLWIVKIAKDHRPATVNRHLACVSRMMNLGIRWGMTDRAPHLGIKRLPEKNARMRILTPAEEAKALGVANPPHDLILLFGLYCGLRRSEIMKLKWADVDIGNRTLKVKSEHAKSGRLRVIPIPRKLWDRMMKEKVRDGAIVRWGGHGFTSPRRGIETVLEKAGITDFHFHDTRHTYASRLAEAGVRIELMQDVLGHASIIQTRRYTHLAGARLRDVSDALDGHKTATHAKLKTSRKGRQLKVK